MLLMGWVVIGRQRHSLFILLLGDDDNAATSTTTVAVVAVTATAAGTALVMQHVRHAVQHVLRHGRRGDDPADSQGRDGLPIPLLLLQLLLLTPALFIRALLLLLLLLFLWVAVLALLVMVHPTTSPHAGMKRGYMERCHLRYPRVVVIVAVVVAPVL